MSGDAMSGLPASRVLWWNPGTSHWVEVDRDAFMRWRGVARWLGDGGDGGDQVWPIIPEGDQRFVVCVMDDDDRTVINFIAHRYTSGIGGRFAGTPTNLDATERKEWDRLYTAATEREGDEAILRELQAKEFGVFKIPPDLLQALVRDMPWPITMQTGFGFWHAYGAHGGAIPNMATRAN